MKINDHVYVATVNLIEGIDVNTFLVQGDEDAVLIDSGVKTMAADIDRLVEESGAKQKLKALMNSHAHVDHIGSNGHIVQKYGVPVIAPLGARAWIEDFSVHYREFCLLYPDIFPDTPDLRNELFPLLDNETRVFQEITEGTTFDLGGGVRLETLWLPGHVFYEVGFFERKTRTLILGDAITGYNWSLIHGHVTRRGYLNTLHKLESFIRTRGVNQVVTGHFAPTDATGAIEHIQAARAYVYTLDETIQNILQEGAPKSLGVVWREVCRTLNKIEEFRGLTTVDAHLKEGLQDGRFVLQGGLYRTATR